MADIIPIIVGGAIALAGSILTQYFTEKHQTKLAIENRRQEILARRETYLTDLMKTLINASLRYQAWITSDKEGKDENGVDKEALARQFHSEFIGAAIAACLATGDEELTRLALNEGGVGLTPYQSGTDFQTQNRNAIISAIRRMAELINENRLGFIDR